MGGKLHTVNDDDGILTRESHFVTKTDDEEQEAQELIWGWDSSLEFCIGVTTSREKESLPHLSTKKHVQVTYTEKYQRLWESSRRDDEKARVTIRHPSSWNVYFFSTSFPRIPQVVKFVTNAISQVKYHSNEVGVGVVVVFDLYGSGTCTPSPEYCEPLDFWGEVPFPGTKCNLSPFPSFRLASSSCWKYEKNKG